MRNDPRYTPSDVFETFPRPAPFDALTDIGRALDTERAAIMRRRALGLTKLYSLVNDPTVDSGADLEIGRIRDLHVALDRAVLDAYGWSDIKTGHGFHVLRNTERWTVSAASRVEILDRLLEENKNRAAGSEGRSGRSTVSVSRIETEVRGNLF
jgi:hypothetical protein